MSIIVEADYAGWLQFAPEQQGDSRYKFLGSKNATKIDDITSEDRFPGSTKVCAPIRHGHFLEFGICRGLKIKEKLYIAQ